ncbi:MAG: aldose epimerase family protein [Pseudomonadota bacterium]
MKTRWISSTAGLRVGTLAIGASLARIQVTERSGDAVDLILGCADASGYEYEHPYFGSIVGRHSNRISGAAFTLDGRRYALTPNVGGDQLHGGPLGFAQRVWRVLDHTEDAVGYGLTSADGDQGYPGELEAIVRYRVRGKDLLIDISAASDAPTVASIAPHPYFNLSGAPAAEERLSQHRLTLAADRYLPIDAALLQQGEVAEVARSPFDLRAGGLLTAAHLEAAHEQIQLAGGFDHHFLLPDDAPIDADGLRHAARLEHTASGRALDVATNQTGMQIYTSNTLDYAGGIGNRHYGRHQALCIEPQGYPDAPNQPGYPSNRLDPGTTYRSVTRLSFDWPATTDQSSQPQ